MIRRTKLLLTAVLLVVLGLTGVRGVFAAFTATDANPGNTFAAGSVGVSDNDGASALLSLSAATPGTTDSGCIKVTYDGSLASTVSLYGTTTGSGLDQYLILRVTRGSYSGAEPAYDACTNFAGDATDYIGAGAGVVYDGTLAAFPETYAAGLVDPTPASPESWTTGESHVYRFEVTQMYDPAAPGLDATQEFTWEARNQ